MDDFIVGGYLPGTNIQLSILSEAILIGALLIFGLILWIEYKRRQPNLPKISLRNVMYANDLHVKLSLTEDLTLHRVEVLQSRIVAAYSNYFQKVSAKLKSNR